ncbi:MAG TPA: MFS transporter [Streptosporangiaceae bacterium]|nr:MFS transporter [Streptosporangiaceae bacterium]
MRPGQRIVLAFLCAGVFLAALDFYIVSIAIPGMLRSFPGTGITGISWVIDGYTVTYTAALLPAGGLADRYGRRRVFLGGLMIFTLAALGCAIAPSAGVLVWARFLQGVGGGTITPIALTLIVPRFPAERRGSAVGLWAATQSAAVAAGPSVGGFLVSAAGWRAVFLLQVPVGLVAILGAVFALRGEAPSAPRGAPGGHTLPDLLGVGLLGGAVGLFALAVVEAKAWGVLSLRTDVAFCCGLGLGVLFVLRTGRVKVPVVDLGLLRIRAVRLVNVAMVLAGLVMFALPFGLVLFLIGVWSYSPARAGLAITPGPVVQAAAALLAARITNRFGARAAAVPGAVLLAAGLSMLALGASALPRYPEVVLPAIVATSTGLGFLITSLSSVIVGAVPAAALASGTALSVTARAIGAIISLSAFALLLAAVPGGTRAASAYHLAWIVMSAIALVLVGVTWSARSGIGPHLIVTALRQE